MYLLGLKNVSTQTVLTDGAIQLTDSGSYRKNCRRNFNGVRVFDITNTSVALNWQGMYHITATLVGTGTEAGDVTVQLYQNGNPITGAISTQTITTADTEFRTFVIDYYILVDDTCVLGCNSPLIQTLSLENTGVGATFTSVVFNVEKVV